MPGSRIFTKGKNCLDRKLDRNCKEHRIGDWDCETLGGRERDQRKPGILNMDTERRK